MNRLAGGDVGDVIEVEEELRVLAAGFHFAWLTRAAFGLLQAVDIEPGAPAKLLDAITGRAGLVGGHFEVDRGRELVGRMLLQL